MLALGLRLFAISMLAIMTVLLKLAGDRGASLAELMFWRQGAAVPVLLLWVWLGPGLASLATKRAKDHARRSCIGLLCMLLNFWSITMLPLAEATTIGFTAPIFATILSVVLLNERVGWHRTGAVLAGFAGVLIMVQPGSGASIPLGGAAAGLGAALLVGFIGIQLRDLGKTEAPLTTAFWFSLLSMAPLGIAYAFYARPHDPLTWTLLIGMGPLGAFGQVALTASLRFAPVSTVVAMDYVSLLWSVLFGWLIWNHAPSPATWIGAPLIIASGLYIAWREHRLQIARAPEIAA